ncbi:DUF6768 family protein [Pelagicoccus sp. SDUM812002]|uniref:DUF6768 family protein n=1 Tax=Pelagicoccus sp. SDUM812002 TaxID=3041266 RepID=UPI002810702E|nr:DUF6768 family protein [Pelagicoccus sp. SDUM812002]MDQ8186607.1 hypothetical protein [Pelagicoccus sp. SDUM812002]
MSDIDEKIRAALRDGFDGEELLEDQSMVAEVLSPFRGRHRWTMLMGFVFGAAGTGLAIWACFKFAAADVVKDQLIWAGVCVLGVLINSMIKIYFWMEMHSNRILREIKRVELLLVKDRE